MAKTCANDRAISVFPRPGKSSMSTCPSARKPSSMSASASRFPTTARSISSRIRSPRVPISPTVNIRSDPFQLVDDLTEMGRRRPGRKAIAGKRPSWPHQFPGLATDQLSRAHVFSVEVDAEPHRQSMGGDLTEQRTEARVQMEAAGHGLLHVVHQTELTRIGGVAAAHVGKCSIEVRPCAFRSTPAGGPNKCQQQDATDSEEVDLEQGIPKTRDRERSDCDRRAKNEAEFESATGDPAHWAPSAQ